MVDLTTHAVLREHLLQQREDNNNTKNYFKTLNKKIRVAALHFDNRGHNNVAGDQAAPTQTIEALQTKKTGPSKDQGLKRGTRKRNQRGRQSGRGRGFTVSACKKQ